MRGRATQWGPVFALLVVAPFVGEFLLGNLTVSALPLGVLLAPMYGCGALLVREIGRRARGWPSMVLLAAAYALLEEGPVDQLLWNDSYANQDLSHGPTYIAAIGMSVALTQQVLSLHTIWSICVPIVLVEEHFLASPWQIGALVVVIVGLVVAASALVPARIERTDGEPPGPWWIGFAALAGSSVILVASDWYGWVGVAVWFVAVGLGGWSVVRWARRIGWTERHTCALGVGATLTYVWISFPVRPEGGGSVFVDLVSNVVFGAAAWVLVVWAMRGAAREPLRSDHRPSATVKQP